MWASPLWAKTAFGMQTGSERSASTGSNSNNISVDSGGFMMASMTTPVRTGILAALLLQAASQVWLDGGVDWHVAPSSSKV